MVLRILKAVFKLALLFACAFALAYGFNLAMDNLILSEVDIYDVAFVFPVKTEFGYFIMRGIFYVFYDSTARFIVILALMLIPYSLISMGTVDDRGYSINNTFLADVKYYINKVITFEKEAWFWGLCFFTSFIPLLAPLALWIILRVLYLVLLIVAAPFIFVVTQVVNAVKGSVG